ncbi:hypothetical protein [[Phormidium ambiguum] IAM M-71]|uniref:hypothetical protein n=1 Tax=[Phormidium ambiguum] IAM M-71 TaxID=454136 RepID=UPI0015BEBB46|nr:hypothetical protein [Phormidium ambiguum]
MPKAECIDSAIAHFRKLNQSPLVLLVRKITLSQVDDTPPSYIFQFIGFVAE